VRKTVRSDDAGLLRCTCEALIGARGVGFAEDFDDFGV